MSKVRKRKRIRKKSNCWLFYTKTEKGGACKLCQKEIISNGNTTNLLNHLKRKHTIQWESAVDINEDVPRLDDDSSEEEEEQQSIELHRSPEETHQTHGLAYQSADGRTVIWLHPDVQMDQLSTAGFQPKITLMGQSSETAQEDTLVALEEKDGETILGVAEEVIHEEDVEEEDNIALSSEDASKTNEANSGERLHITESFVVDSEPQKDEVIMNTGEVCQITVVTSAEALKEKLGINSAPKVSYINPSPATITVSSPQKVVVTHASSHKSKKLRQKKRCKHSSDNDDSFQNKPCKSIAHHKFDSQLEESTCLSRGCCEMQKEDSFDHFGKYIATLLRNLPSRKSACKLQKEMINWVLKEQMLFED